MSNKAERRKIDDSTIDKVVSRLNRDFIEGLPGDPKEIATKYARRIVEPYISPSINDQLKEMMLEKRLSDEEYVETFLKIIYHSFHNKKTSDNPKAYILLSQTGGGKSNLRERVLRENPNVVLLDSDSYKKFRPDSTEIQDQYPQYYGALTGIDCYDHVENVSNFTMENGYDFLIESAPSISQGVIGVNTEELERLGYEINYYALAIGDIVSQMAVHKRYEYELRDDILKKSAKLTDIDRHNDSYAAVQLVLENASPESRIVVFRRGTEEENQVPQIIESGSDKKSKMDTLESYRRKSNEEYLASNSFLEDYYLVRKLLLEREAPRTQIVQLESVSQNARLRGMQLFGDDYQINIKPVKESRTIEDR